MAQIPDLLKLSVHVDDIELFRIALKSTNCIIKTITNPDPQQRITITVDSQDIMNIYELGRVFGIYMRDKQNSKSKIFRKNIQKN